MSGRQLRIVPYNGNRDYQVYLDGWKVNGKRKRLYFKDRAEAEKKLKELAKRQKKEGDAGLDIPLDLRVMAVKAAKRLDPFGKSILQAAEFYAEHLDRESNSVPVAAAVAEYLAAKERAGLSARHIRDIKGRIGRFESEFGRRLIRTISVQEIEVWLNSLALGAQSTINYRAVANAFFEYSRKRGIVQTNPATPIEKAKVVDRPPEIFAPDELARLLISAPYDLLPALAVQAFAGVRTEETMRITWEDIDRARKYIAVAAHKSKTARRRLIPISSNLAGWLGPYSDMAGPIWPKGGRLYHKAIKALLSEVGLVRWPKNGLRHSFASYHLAKHQNAAELSLQMGHSTTKLIFSAYREVVTPEEAERYWNIIPPRVAENIVLMSAPG